MIRKTMVATAMFAVFFGSTLAEQEGEKKGPSLVDKWIPLDFHLNGEKQPDEACAEQMFIFTEKEFHLVMMTKQNKYDALRCSVTYDDSKTPAQFDFVVPRNTTYRGIYKFDGDRLMLAFRDRGDGIRPMNFSPSPKDGNYIFALVRKK